MIIPPIIDLVETVQLIFQFRICTFASFLLRFSCHKLLDNSPQSYDGWDHSDYDDKGAEAEECRYPRIPLLYTRVVLAAKACGTATIQRVTIMMRVCSVFMLSPFLAHWPCVLCALVPCRFSKAHLTAWQIIPGLLVHRLKSVIKYPSLATY